MASIRPGTAWTRLRRLALCIALAGLAGAAPTFADDGGGGGGGGGGDGGPGGDGGGPGGGDPGQQAVPELIGLDLTPTQRAALVRLGFTFVQEGRLTALGRRLDRIRPPAFAQAELLERLRRAGLDGRLAPNDRYAMASACAGDRCFGAGLVGWPLPERAARCGAGLRIGIVDSAVDVAHPALRGARVTSRDFDGSGRSREHGTALAALLVGQPGSPNPGLVPAATLLAANVMQTDWLGRTNATAYRLVEALDWLTAQRVRVINLSLAGPENPVLGEAVARALARNVAIAAAAGNDGPGAPPAYPAAYPGVVGVTAVDARLAPYRRATPGPHVDFAAPGVGVWTAALGSDGRYDAGTSLATAFVTAAIGAADPAARRPSRMVVDALARDVRDLGERGRDPVFGWGLLQVRPRC